MPSRDRATTPGDQRGSVHAASTAARRSYGAGRILRFPPARIALALLFVVGAQGAASLLVLGPVRGAPGVVDGSAPDFLLVGSNILVVLLA